MVKLNAILNLVQTELGGRKTGISSGYRADVQIADRFTAISLVFNESILPGDTRAVIAILPNFSYVKDFVLLDNEYSIFEGNKKIATILFQNFI